MNFESLFRARDADFVSRARDEEWRKAQPSGLTTYLPAVGYRQWVLSFEGSLAVRLGYDSVLLAKVADRFARAVMQDLRCSVKAHHGLCSVKFLHARVLTGVQRFRSDLGLYVYLHCLVTGGCL